MLVFLPVTTAVFFFLSRRMGKNAAIAWLAAASLFFYAWWNPVYVFLLLASILCNYALSLAIRRFRGKRKLWLCIGVAFNLAILFYFKYANFFLQTLESFGADGAIVPYASANIILPLGISFITFQKIAYLVDVYRSADAGFGFLRYCFFVTFFPQLIAGPIVRPSDIRPQLEAGSAFRFLESNFAAGLTIFVIGLWKKVVFADSVAAFASPIFQAADAGVQINFMESWMGALAYTLQLYFDFSGYADMAIGSARIFGVHLPVNFNSPYKSGSIIMFWRTWHITLSNYLRDYLYIPMGGSRKGGLRTYSNLFLTMLIGGLWHGAGWTFVFWGALHGAYLVVNHLWRALRFSAAGAGSRIVRGVYWLLTFFCVVASWVFFRAETFNGAWNMLRGMAGFRGIALPSSYILRAGESSAQWMSAHGFTFNLIETMVLRPDAFSSGAKWIAILLLVVLFAPNTQEFMGSFLPIINPDKHPAPPRKFAWHWRPDAMNAGIIALMSVVSLAMLALMQEKEFLYFQF